MVKKILFTVVFIFTVAGIVLPRAGTATIENFQVSGSKYSWDLYFERTDNWSTNNTFKDCAASFNFNESGLTNPAVQVNPSGPLAGVNFTVTVQILAHKVIVNIAGTGTSANTLSLGVKTKLLTVTMDITSTSQTSQLSWDDSNTGFFDEGDNNITTSLQGSDNQALPVELTSFTALVNTNNVNLNWKTATEVNNNGFEIQRAVRGQQSEVSSWQKVGFVEGHGNSSSPKEYTYEDKNLTGGTKFIYRLKQIDNDGEYEYSKEVEVEVVPKKYTLYQNYPNPFNPSTTIKYDLPQSSEVNLTVYNILGEKVRTLVNGMEGAGYHSVEFDASNLASGTYIYRLQAQNFIQTKKMLLLK